MCLFVGKLDYFDDKASVLIASDHLLSSVDSGIRPDIHCDSRFGIPRHVGADICVGMALDVLEDSELSPLAALQRSGDLGIAKADD